MQNFRMQYSLVAGCWGCSLPEFQYVGQGIPFKTCTDLSKLLSDVLEKVLRFRILCSSWYFLYVVVFWSDRSEIIGRVWPEIFNLAQTPDARTKAKKDVVWMPVDRYMVMNVYYCWYVPVQTETSFLNHNNPFWTLRILFRIVMTHVTGDPSNRGGLSAGIWDVDRSETGIGGELIMGKRV